MVDKALTHPFQRTNPRMVPNDMCLVSMETNRDGAYAPLSSTGYRGYRRRGRLSTLSTGLIIRRCLMRCIGFRRSRRRRCLRSLCKLTSTRMLPNVDRVLTQPCHIHSEFGMSTYTTHVLSIYFSLTCMVSSLCNSHVMCVQCGACVCAFVCGFNRNCAAWAWVWVGAVLDTSTSKIIVLIINAWAFSG